MQGSGKTGKRKTLPDQLSAVEVRALPLRIAPHPVTARCSPICYVNQACAGVSSGAFAGD